MDFNVLMESESNDGVVADVKSALLTATAATGQSGVGAQTTLIIATKSLPTAARPNKRFATTTTSTTIDGQPTATKCSECGKAFVSVAKLKSHVKTHYKTRPFKCIDCSKTFTVRYSLICHTRTHTREKPYQCSICLSRFTQASSLKTHQIYKHTKAFPYICKQCGRGFISPGQKHEHVSRSHAPNKHAMGGGAAGGGGGRKCRAPKAVGVTSQACQTALSLI